MTIKQAKKSANKWYALQRLLSVGGTSGYILYHTGIFTNTVSDRSVKSAVYIVLGWALIVLIRDRYKQAIAKDNPDVKQLANMTALKEAIPWIIILMIASAIKFGINNMYQHLTVITSFMLISKFAYAKRMVYELGLKRGIYGVGDHTNVRIDT